MSEIERAEQVITPTPIHVAEFEGEYVRVMEGKLPALNLEMPEGYKRGTHIVMAIEVCVRNVRYEEIRSGENKGDLMRQHIFSIEDARMIDAMTAEAADAGVGGSANELIQHLYEIDGPAGKCWFDGERMELHHLGGCEMCEDRVEETEDNFEGWRSPFGDDAGLAHWSESPDLQ